MGERDDRHLDPDERSDLVRVHAGRVHDDVRLDRVALGEADAGHAPALDVDAGHPRSGPHPRAATLSALRERHREVRRVQVPVGGQVGRPLDPRRVEQRPELAPPPPSRRCAEAGRRFGPNRPTAGAPRSAPSTTRVGANPPRARRDRCRSPVRAARYSSTPYIIIFVRLTLDPELTDQPGRVEGRAARELGAVDEQHVVPSHLRAGGTRCSHPRHRRRRSRPGRDRPTRQIASVAWSSQRSNRRSAIERESRSKCLSAYAT